MVKRIFTFTVAGLIAGMFMTGCGKTSEQKIKTADENVANAKQDLQNAQTEFDAEWTTFKNESEQAIDANERRIDAFKEKMEKAGPKMNAKYSKDVAALEQRNSDLKKKLEEYKNEGTSKWQEFKTNFKNDLDGVGKTMKDLFKD